MSLHLVAAGELPAAQLAPERLLAGVRPDVRRQVVAPAEHTLADLALERLLARVDPEVPGQLVAPREPAVARLERTSVRSLLRWNLSRPGGGLSLLHG